MFKKFTKQLLEWHGENQRELPWKKERDPYKTWVSEIILQQTKVAQGTPYYINFVSHFPDVKTLAKSSEEQVLKVWQGLGYYSRARNMHKSAQYICDKLDGVFPKDYDDILALKGVGPYTAAAIASFVYDLSYPVVDGNVLRVMSRVFGIEKSIDATGTKKEILLLSQQCINIAAPAIYNQAIMDFGAMQCLPKKPKCGDCKIKLICMSYKDDKVSEIPFRTKKVKNRSRYFHYTIFIVGDDILMRKRTEKDIWQGLYDFPLLEQEEAPSRKEVISFYKDQFTVVDCKEETQSKCKNDKQKLTHQTIHAHFTVYRVQKIIIQKEIFQLVNRALVYTFAVPKIIDKFLAENSITLF